MEQLSAISEGQIKRLDNEKTNEVRHITAAITNIIDASSQKKVER